MAYTIPGKYPSIVSTRSIQNSTCIVPERKLHKIKSIAPTTPNPKYEKIINRNTIHRKKEEAEREQESEYTTAITEENTNGR